MKDELAIYRVRIEIPNKKEIKGLIRKKLNEIKEIVEENKGRYYFLRKYELKYILEVS